MGTKETTSPSAASGETRKPDETQQYRIRDLSRIPRLRGRIAILITLLTFGAGWTDLLAYLFLGRVFASFMTGNILFVGFALSEGDYNLLGSALVAILVNFAGVAVGSLIVQRAPILRTVAGWRSVLVRTLAIEWCLLFIFTVLILVTNMKGQGTGLFVLGIAAMAMGIQGGVVISFDIPGIVANALTAVVILLGQAAGQDIDHTEEQSAWKWKNQFRVGLLLTYAIGALIVGLTSSAAIIRAGPLVILTGSIVFILAVL
jgi:uncharacterized membrane protein YoaK (UPF0700 family)